MNTQIISPKQGILVASIGVTVLIGLTLWKKQRQEAIENPTPEFKFPTAHLAALDRDLQARFAVVPTSDFGIERTYGYQHDLYNPQTPVEKRTIANLKKEGTDAAFYLMSRAMWLRAWDGAGYKPIQGPVYITRKIDAPLPRKINFTPRQPNRNTDILDEENADAVAEKNAPGGGIPTHNREGTPVPAPTPPKNSPRPNRLQLIGKQIFAFAEDAPSTANIGLVEPINQDWKVVAVPIRASKPECISCHIYQPIGKKVQGRTKIKVGDTLGVAFYLYSTNSQKTPAKPQSSG